jgi:hypothetical protein
MIPVVVFWTKYTATVSGRVVKLVPCEYCATEYVYVLEREGTGVGTSVYALTDDTAQGHAASAAEDTLRQALENDFDPVPCPVCGHYQRYMFPKLMEDRSLWGPLAGFAALFVGALAAVAAMYWTLGYVKRPTDAVLWRMVAAWAGAGAAALVGVAVSAVRRAREQRFDPNTGDPQARISEGRRRAVTRAEFEAAPDRLPGLAAAAESGRAPDPGRASG